MSEKNQKKAEILAPAGNREKLRFAVKYGADAVYFGGDEFNLRVRAGNFSPGDIEESIDFCRSHGVRTVFLMNAFLHEDDLPAARVYIERIKKYPFDAVMVSDPGMLLLLKEAGVTAEFHLSTQMNTLNHLSMRFWREAGFSRVVLGREATLDEVRKISARTDMEIEVFAHGALCVAYSGRCLLSRYLSGRDANQGDCAQPCRWDYKLVEMKRPGNYLDIIEHASGTEILSSKDLCLIQHLEEYLDAGVHAFKIEGRMKSLYHAANTTRVYRHALSVAGTDDFRKHLPFWLNELDLISHRPYTDNLFNEFGNAAFEGVPYVKKAMFMGYKEGTGDDARQALVRTSNPIYRGENLEGIFPIHDVIRDDIFQVMAIRDAEGNDVDMARPNSLYTIVFDKDVDEDAIFRKRIGQ
ncbi:MAG: peptidase U32 [Spirochaetae bacterium HGW-Spirochaetae-1]|jgi:putative protease|nr:MAG: peptidase U32 [Spirochaetae bacterium HGW-Spirochaetae-1]